MPRTSLHTQRNPLLRLGNALGLGAILLLPGTAAAGSWDTRTAAGMEVHVYTPDSLSPVGDGRGLMLVMHGCVQTHDDLQSLGNLEAGAETFGVVMAVPLVPNGGVYAGCWDYYGPMHTRDNRHNDDLLALTAELSADPQLTVDPAQVYITGFSSGGGQAVALGCLAPDIYAGVGIAAGPSLGTDAFEIGFVSTDAQTTATLCESIAGGYAGEFATQLVGVFTGTSDFTVAQEYATINADMFAIRYGGLSPQPGALDVSSVPGHEPAGEGTLYSDNEGPRIALIKATGAPHAWPAGSGPGVMSSFVQPSGVDYGSFLADFFTANNRRVEDGEDPTTGGESDTDSDSDGSESDASSGSSDSDASATDGSGSEGSDTDEASESGGSDAGSGDGSDSDESEDSSESSDSGASASGTPNYDTNGMFDDGSEDGCSCTQQGSSTSFAPLLLMFAFGLRRRSNR